MEKCRRRGAKRRENAHALVVGEAWFGRSGSTWRRLYHRRGRGSSSSSLEVSRPGPSNLHSLKARSALVICLNLLHYARARRKVEWRLVMREAGTTMAVTTRLLVLYHSSYGHTETLAYAVVLGARAVGGVQVSVKRVPELMPEDVMRAAGMKVDQPAPIADPQELADYDGIVLGTPTRFGNMTSQMRNFLDQTGPLWVSGALIGKVGSVFTSTSTGGGNETTIISFHWTLLHHGMVVVGLPYSAPDLPDISEVRGSSPYGAGTIAAPDGSRLPSQKELNLASFQGHHVGKIAKKLATGQ